MSNWFNHDRQAMRLASEQGDGLLLGILLLIATAIIIGGVLGWEYLFCTVHGVLSI